MADFTAWDRTTLEQFAREATAKLIENKEAIEELREALKPFAHCATVFDDKNRGSGMPNSGIFQSWPRMYGDFDLTVEDLRNARAAITKHESTTKEQA